MKEEHALEYIKELKDDMGKSVINGIFAYGAGTGILGGFLSSSNSITALGCGFACTWAYRATKDVFKKFKQAKKIDDCLGKEWAKTFLKIKQTAKSKDFLTGALLASGVDNIVTGLGDGGAGILALGLGFGVYGASRASKRYENMYKVSIEELFILGSLSLRNQNLKD